MAKPRKIDPAIVVAVIGLIGVIITAVTSSPIILALIQQASTPTSPPTLGPTFQPVPIGATVTRTLTTPAQPSTVFEDNFGGTTLDLSKWSLDNFTNNVVSVGGGVLLSSSNDRSPYIYSRTNPFPISGDFRFTIDYRYSKVDVCGTYISLTSALVSPFVQPQEFRWTPVASASELSFFIWHEVIWYDTQSRRQNIPILGDYTSTREITVSYQNSHYSVLQEGTPVFTSDTTVARPRYLAFGNAAIQPANCPWDTLEIKSVRVETLP